MKLLPSSLVLAALLLALPVHAAATASADSGTFQVSREGKVLGIEKFSYLPSGDSLIINSRVVQLYPGQAGHDTLSKEMLLVVGARDYDLKSYSSNQRFHGQRLQRGLVMGDTSLSSYFQVNDAGQGDEMVRKPGKMYVVDPQLFVLYDVICRNLHQQSFDQRPVLMFSLGRPDVFIEATAKDMGFETIRWGKRPVRARKLSIFDPEMQFFVWISPNGTMLRLEQPQYGMLVEREQVVRSVARRRPTAG